MPDLLSRRAPVCVRCAGAPRPRPPSPAAAATPRHDRAIKLHGWLRPPLRAGDARLAALTPLSPRGGARATVAAWRGRYTYTHSRPRRRCPVPGLRRSLHPQAELHPQAFIGVGSRQHAVLPAWLERTEKSFASRSTEAQAPLRWPECQPSSTWSPQRPHPRRAPACGASTQHRRW